MLKIAVVDDDVKFRTRIRDFIYRYFNQETNRFHVRCYADGVEFLSDEENKFDIVMIDILMPHMNGIEVAQRLRQQDKTALVMFITATPDFAIRGYEVSAVDYVLKPLSYETDFRYKFDRVVQRALQLRQRRLELVLKDENGQFIRLDADELCYVVKDRDNAIYHTVQGDFSQRTSIAKVRQSLEGAETFALVNSGCLVNLAFVHKVQGTLVEMTDGARLVLSRGKKKDFYETFFDYMEP